MVSLFLPSYNGAIWQKIQETDALAEMVGSLRLITYQTRMMRIKAYHQVTK